MSRSTVQYSTLRAGGRPWLRAKGCEPRAVAEGWRSVLVFLARGPAVGACLVGAGVRAGGRGCEPRVASQGPWLRAGVRCLYSICWRAGQRSVLVLLARAFGACLFGARASGRCLSCWRAGGADLRARGRRGEQCVDFATLCVHAGIDFATLFFHAGVDFATLLFHAGCDFATLMFLSRCRFRNLNCLTPSSRCRFRNLGFSCRSRFRNLNGLRPSSRYRLRNLDVFMQVAISQP